MYGFGFGEERSLRFRIVEYMKVFVVFLIIVWFFKGLLKFEVYNDYMVYVIIVFIFVFEFLSVGKWFGVMISGIVFVLVKGVFWMSVFLFFGKWFGFLEMFIGENVMIIVGMMFVYVVVFIIVGFFLFKFDERRIDWKVEKKVYEFNGVFFGEVKFNGSGKVYFVKFGRKFVGWVIDGDLMVEVEILIGKVIRKFFFFVVVWILEKIVVKKIFFDFGFVKRVNEFINLEGFYYDKNKVSVVDFGVVKVYEGNGFEYVKVFFVEVISILVGEEVKIGFMRLCDGCVWKFRGEMFIIREFINGF